MARMKNGLKYLLMLFMVVLLTGCTARVQTEPNRQTPLTFDNVTGTVIDATRNIASPGLTLAFYANFEKTTGKLDYEVVSPKGDTIANGPLLSTAENQTKESDEEKAKWGMFQFSKVVSDAGDYKIKIIGEHASGSVQLLVVNEFTFANFTGQVAKAEQDVKQTGENVAFTVIAKYASGAVNAKVFDPAGNVLVTHRLNQDGETPTIFFQPAEKTGVYKAIIEAEGATGSALATPFAEKQVSWLFFIRPLLMALLALVFIISVGKKNTKVMIWGAMLMLIGFFVGNMTGQVIIGQIGLWINSPLSYLVPALIGAGISAIIQTIAIIFSKYIGEMKTVTPNELYGFMVGFVMVEPLMAAFGGFTTLFSFSTRNLPFSFLENQPRDYINSTVAFYDSVIPFLQRAFAMIIIMAVVAIVLWVMRKKGQRPMPMWAYISIAAGIKVLLDVLLSYSTVLPINGKMLAALWETFPLGDPMTQGVAITAILAVGAGIVFTYRGRIAQMLRESCEVTINDLKAKK